MYTADGRIGIRLLVLTGALAVLCTYTAWESTRALDLYYALVGWSPIDWINHRSLPAQFVRDFETGISAYERSAFMHVYPIAMDWLGIEPERALTMVVWLEVLLTMAAFLVLARTMAPRYPPLALLVLTALALTSNARYPDLSRAAAPFFIGLYYTAAEAARLLGVSFALRRAWVAAAIALAFAIITHPVLGGAAVVFAAAAALADPASRGALRSTRAMFAGGVFFAIVCGWFLTYFSDLGTAATADNDTWILVGHAFNYHFFPVVTGMFGSEHTDRFLPLVSLMVLTAHYVGRDVESSGLRRALAAGLVALGVVSAAGVAISMTGDPGPIKLSLHRASGLMAAIGMVVVAHGIVRDLIEGSRLRQALALTLLVCPFVLLSGFPLVLVLILVASERLWPGSRASMPGQRTVLALAAGAAVLGTGYWIGGLIGPYQAPAYIGARWMGVLFIAWLTFTVAVSIPVFARWRTRLVTAAIAALLTLLVPFWTQHRPMGRVDVALARDFKEAQLWARDATPKTALFMVDPTIHYGWRDYSQRSSFGNLREWVYTSWVYVSDATRFADGKSRLEAFGLSVEEYLHDTPPFSGSIRLGDDLQRTFYARDEEALCRIVRRFEIDFLVMLREKATRNYTFPRRFENGRFLVMEAACGTRREVGSGPAGGASAARQAIPTPADSSR